MIGLLLIGGMPFRLFIAMAALIGFYEFIKMNGFKMTEAASLIGYAGILYFILFGDQTVLQPSSAIWLWMLLFFAVTVFSRNQVNLDRISLLFIGFIYIGSGFYFIVATRLMEDGLFWTFLLFSCIWATDIGAYFTGMAIGKRPLLPEISPKKTVEGAVGGLLLSLIVSLVYSLAAPELLTVKEAVWIAVVSALFGQLGDLIQSAYKRIRNVKDSGAILPGHGGVLDRCDSWLIVFPAAHLLSLLPS
jgi:phosphatidate cytidylyltransferase